MRTDRYTRNIDKLDNCYWNFLVEMIKFQKLVANLTLYTLCVHFLVLEGGITEVTKKNWFLSSSTEKAQWDL